MGATFLLLLEDCLPGPLAFPVLLPSSETLPGLTCSFLFPVPGGLHTGVMLYIYLFILVLAIEPVALGMPGKHSLYQLTCVPSPLILDDPNVLSVSTPIRGFLSSLVSSWFIPLLIFF